MRSFGTQKRRHPVDVLAAFEQVASQCCAEVAGAPRRRSAECRHETRFIVPRFWCSPSSCWRTRTLATSQIIEHPQPRRVSRARPISPSRPSWPSPADPRCGPAGGHAGVVPEHLHQVTSASSVPAGGTSQVTGQWPCATTCGNFEPPPAGYRHLRGVRVHGRIVTPCGKVERFHRMPSCSRPDNPGNHRRDLRRRSIASPPGHNEIRPHCQRMTLAAFDSRDKARPHNRSQAISRVVFVTIRSTGTARRSAIRGSITSGSVA